MTRDDLRTEFTPGEPGAAGIRPTLAEVERAYIRRILDETKGDKRAAAQILGLSVRTLQRIQASLSRVSEELAPKPDESSSGV